MISSSDCTITTGSLFAGIGGFCVGFESQGIKTKWAVENDLSAVATYSSNLGKGKIVTKDGIPQSVRDVTVRGSGLQVAF